MLEKVACPCDGGTLDRLIQPAILVVVGRWTAPRLPAHGANQQVTRLRGAEAGHVGRVPLLKHHGTKRLGGLLWDAPEKGPARKSYQLTAAGADCLRRWIKTLENHRRRISAFLVAARKVSPRQPRELCCDEQ